MKLKVELAPKPVEMTWPSIENETHIIATGQGKAAEDVFRIGLSEMILWLEAEYDITQGEAVMFLS